jgi:hypothetical protein
VKKYLWGISIIFINVLVLFLFIGCANNSNNPNEDTIRNVSDTKKIPQPNNTEQTEQTQPKQEQPKQEQENLTIAGNVFDLSSVKPGQTLGVMNVSNVKSQDGFITVFFKGETTISGTYSSDWEGIFGEYITLKLDEQSQKKVPILSDGDLDIILDPANPQNKEILKSFGETGTKGNYKIVIDEFVITNYIESFTRTAVIKKIISVEKSK